MSQTILAVDLDGVLHDHRNPIAGKTMGAPMSGARDAICYLKNEKGCKIIIFSVKPPDIIEDWLRYFDIPFDRITNMKPAASAYIDDKGLHHVDWDDTLTQLNRRGLI